MSIYAWPTTRAFWPAAMRWGQSLNQTGTVSPLSGYAQAVSVPGTRWTVSLDMPQHTYAERRELAAFIERLEGAAHWITLHDWTHPTPAGTANTSGVTVGSGGVAQFAQAVPLAGLGAGKTLLAGDWISIAGQRLRVAANATADGAGAASVAVLHQLRAAAAFGAAVVLDTPATTFRLRVQSADTPPIPFGASNIAPPFTLDFVEVWA